MSAMLQSHTPSAVGKDGAEGSVCKDLKICRVLSVNIQGKSAFRKGARMAAGKECNNPACQVQDH